MAWKTRLTAAVLLALSATALAQDDEEPPPPPIVVKHIPPRFSWEIAINPSYGMLPQFVDTPAWVGIGLRGGWGKHYGPHRLGAGLSFTFEGPLAVEWSNNFEPMMMYDWIHKSGLWLGASLGPTLMLNSQAATNRKLETTFLAAPFAAFRIGFSRPWSLLFKRFFIGIEPKLRVVNGQPAGIVSLVIGSGTGY